MLYTLLNRFRFLRSNFLSQRFVSVQRFGVPPRMAALDSEDASAILGNFTSYSPDGTKIATVCEI